MADTGQVTSTQTEEIWWVTCEQMQLDTADARLHLT